MKPRVYWFYYTTLQRGYWRVSRMPVEHFNNPPLLRLWRLAHEAAGRENDKIGYPLLFGKKELR